MEIKEKGRLTVNGGNAQQTASKYDLGGGAGGVIQIISPEGTLAAGTLSLKHGHKSGTCNAPVENGYFHLPGNTIFSNPDMQSRHRPSTVDQICHSLTFSITSQLLCAFKQSVYCIPRWTCS